MAPLTTRLPSIIAAIVAVGALGCVPMRDLETVRPTGSGHHYVDVEGVRHHVEISGEGEPVVLLHGFGGSSYSWRKLEPALAERYRVVRIDLVGFGYSDRPAERDPFRRDRQTARLVEVARSLGIDRAHWVGHSYGGGLAIAIAADAPEIVRSLTLIDAVGPNYSVDRQRAVARLTPFAYAYVRGVGLRKRFIRRVLKRTVHDPSTVTPRDVHEYRDRLRIEGAVQAFQHLSVGSDPDARRIELGEVEAPTLVFWGAHDPLMSTEIGAEGVRELPNARPLVIVEEAGHSPMEERPDAVLEHLLPFLAETSRDFPTTDPAPPGPRGER